MKVHPVHSQPFRCLPEELTDRVTTTYQIRFFYKSEHSQRLPETAKLFENNCLFCYATEMHSVNCITAKISIFVFSKTKQIWFFSQSIITMLTIHKQFSTL